MTLIKQNGQYKLISKQQPHRVLKIFGKRKLTQKEITKEERRINFFKHLNK